MGCVFAGAPFRSNRWWIWSGGPEPALKRTLAVLALALLWVWGAAPAHSEPPASAENTTKAPVGKAPRLVWYRIRRGDTLDSISRRFGVSVPEIERWNHLRGSRIDVGRLLRLRVGGGKLIVRRRVVHYRRRYWSPWNVSSFGDPEKYDDAEGENPVIRKAAIEALGRWNGSVVVVDPNTGRILTIVNQRLALSSGFTPCSTFKPIVALEALQQHVITPETRIWVGRRWRVSLTYALAHSNNEFFMQVGKMLGYRRLAYAARQFGYGERAGLDIPDESPGAFPASDPEPGGAADLAYIGEDMSVTTLQLAAAVSAIANGGTLYYLQYPRTAAQIASFRPIVRRRLTQFVPYIPEVRAGMAAAVTSGTARRAYDPVEPIYGKTGTCSEDGARLGWFGSFADDQGTQYVVVVLLRGGRPMFGPHAAAVAGRLYKNLYEQQLSAERMVAPAADVGQSRTDR